MTWRVRSVAKANTAITRRRKAGATVSRMSAFMAASVGYIEACYNRKRLHSTLGYQSPARYMQQRWRGQQRQKQAA
ncbi:MAG: IS3 family transposase [Burkholderiaceae bacterium]